MSKIYNTAGNPFKVPENYFLNLEERIEEKLHNTEISSPKTSFIQIIKPYLWLTSVFVGLYIFTNILLNTKIDSEHKIIKASNIIPSDKEAKLSEHKKISNEDIIVYLSDSDIDSDLIISSLQEQNE